MLQLIVPYIFLHPRLEEIPEPLWNAVWDHNRLSWFCPVALVLVPFPVLLSLCVSSCPETARAAFPTDLSI